MGLRLGTVNASTFPWYRNEKRSSPSPAVTKARLGTINDCLLGQLDRFLPNHLLRILVFSESKKDWLPETIISRPFCEFYLADHFRFHPMATFHFGGSHPFPISPAPLFRQIDKRALVAANFVELRKESAQKLYIEAGADFASKIQFLVLVDGDKQRTEMLPASSRFRIRRNFGLRYLRAQ